MKFSLTMVAFVLLLIVSVVLFGCKGKQEGSQQQTQEAVPQPEKQAFVVHSTAFDEGGWIPKKYTCEGENVSPEIVWQNPPEGTQSFALICDDPDAPMKVWVHWVIWGIPKDATSLKEAIPTEPTLDDGSLQGKNDFGKIGYGGPCPPPGKPHRYFFKLYALDTIPQLEPGATKDELLKAIDGHILGQCQTMGKYQR